MKLLWHCMRQRIWLMVLPLLLILANGSGAFAATTPSYSATASGTANNLTVMANVSVGSADIGKNGNYYLGFKFQQEWFFNNGAGWLHYAGGTLPIYAAAPLAHRSIEAVHNEDVSNLIGGELYVGYGLDETDMLANTKYGMVYTVMADTTAPTVTGTINANGAINVAINTQVGITFSESMDPFTVNSENFTLEETFSGSAISGTVNYTGVSAVFTPLVALTINTSYTVRVKGGASGVKDLAGNALASDFVIRWTTGLAPDIVAPTVTGTLHPNGTSNVPINTKANAIFSEGMDPFTLNTSTFLLKHGTTAVTGTVTFSGVTAIFTPSSSLADGTTYTATITTGAKDLAGNALASDYVWSWTTAEAQNNNTDNNPPTVTGSINTNGATNVAINSAAGITFSEGMDPLTITNVNFTLTETSGGAAVAGTVSYTGVNAVFTPLANLTSSTGYTVTVKGGHTGVQDLAGNALASDFVIAWTTAAAPDTTAPTVTGTIHANGATDVAINSASGITFSEGMDPLTITNVNFALTETSGGATVAGTVSYTGVNAVFTPLANLASSTGYTVTVKSGASGVKDLAGNALASDFVIAWTTAAAPDTTAPTVSSTTPVDGASGVCINRAIYATFNEGMDPLTITNVNFALTETSGGAAVAGLVSYDALTRIASFTPSADLTATTGYTATIKGGVGGVEDLAGNVLVADKLTLFTSNAAPCVTLAAVPLGTSGNFAILAKSGISTVPTSVITGDIGASPVAASFITGFTLIADASNVFSTSTQVVGGGKVYASNYAVPTPANLTTAVSDMETAYTNAAGRPTPDYLNLGSGNIGGMTLTPGLYNWSSSVTLPSDVALVGSATDVWIFQMSGDLIMSSAKRITLSGGALAKNIFWQVAGQATIGTTAHFEGIILAQTGVTLQTGATMNGRVLAQTLVALESATITQPAP